MKVIHTKFFIFIIAMTAIALTARFAFAQTSGDDAIAVRIMPNIEHYSALRWYQKNIPKEKQGSPSQLLVDGYNAVRDGRTVYVNAGNVYLNKDDHNVLYTNMYILSYTQNASGETQDIFGQLLNNWTFNINVVKDGGAGVCRALKDNVATTQACYTDYDCGLQSPAGGGASGNYCSSPKAKLTRDVRRLADLRTITDAVKSYVESHGNTPVQLLAGSYIRGKSISVWPSWQETLGQFVGATLPVDPLNSLWGCRNDTAKDPAGDGTCWNDTEKKFNNGSDNIPNILESLGRVYAYKYIDDATPAYQVCADNEAMGVGEVYAIIHGEQPECF